MWIMSKHGFFSIVEKSDGFHIRSRELQDIQSVVNCLASKTIQILESQDNDYRYRVIVGKRELQKVIKWLGDSIDYPNFKAQIDADPTQQRKPYHQVWSVLAQALGAYGRKGSH